MTALKNHPGRWLADPAAQSLARFEAAHGVIRINSAGRTAAEQQGLITRWDRGGASNRPPYLYAPARPAHTSPHVAGGGLAIDTPDVAHMHRHAGRFGWVQTHPSDPVHWVYFAERDQTRAPAYPLPAGWYFGPQSGPRESVSGFHGNREHLRVWQQRMADRGWKITVDGLYGDETGDVAEAFQAEKGLTVDRLIGRETWAAAWTAPIT